MTAENVRRKLAAILCADVQGYSRLIQDDPEGTLHTLTEYRAVFTRCSECLGGRVVDSPGDNLLIEFPSTVDAVQCAVEIQRELAEKNAELAEDRRMRFRIGIDLGDVLEENGSLYGDGVNISARLQSLAESGGICISGKVYDQVVNRLPLKFEFVGKRPIKNFAEPMRIYRVLTKPGDAAHRVVRARREVSRRWRTAAVAAIVVMAVAVGGAIGWLYYGQGAIVQSTSVPAPDALAPTGQASIAKASPPSHQLSPYAPTGLTPDAYSMTQSALEKGEAPKSEKPSIAVLAFVNMSDDREQEFFSDGITEELIGALAKLEGIKVISRTSTFYFKGKDVDLRTIGEKLGVEHVLEGSVRKAGNTLRISAQLIKVSDDVHLWAETYDRELKDVFNIQDEITRTVVNKLKIKLLGNKETTLVNASTRDMEAYNLMLQGRYFYYQGTPETRKKAFDCYQKAIERDPLYAPAYVQLAWWYTDIVTGATGGTSRDDFYTKALSAISKAMEIDSNLADAYATLGIIKSMYEYDWKGAERCCQKALKLNPTSFQTHQGYQAFLRAVGRIDEAITESQKALELDPLSAFALAHLGVNYNFARKHDQAIAQLNQALAIYPKFMPARLYLGQAYGAKGMYEEAIDVYRKGLSDFPNQPFYLGNLGYIYARAGKADEARKIIETMNEMASKGYMPFINHAKIYAWLGDLDRAFEYLEKAYEAKEGSGLMGIKLLPDLDPIRSDPRYNSFLKKMGLAD